MSLENYNLAAISNGGVPVVAINGGAWLPNPAGGVGDFNLQTTPTGGFPADASVMAATKIGVLGPSGLRTIAHTPMNAENHAMTTLEEGALGAASVYADYDFGLLVAMLGIWSQVRVLAMGRITGGLNPAWEWSLGGIDQATPITRTAPGNYTFDLLPEQGLNGATDGIILCQAATPGLGRLRSLAINHVSNTRKQLTQLEEGPGGIASLLVDTDVNVIVLALGARKGLSVGKLHAACSIVGNPVTPTYLWASGAIDQAAGLNRTGAGVYTIQYLADQGIAANESLHFCMPRTHQAPSGMQAIKPERTSTTQCQLRALQEGALGALSVGADIDMDVLSFRIG